MEKEKQHNEKDQEYAPQTPWMQETKRNRNIDMIGRGQRVPSANRLRRWVSRVTIAPSKTPESV